MHIVTGRKDTGEKSAVSIIVYIEVNSVFIINIIYMEITYNLDTKTVM